MCRPRPNSVIAWPGSRLIHDFHRRSVPDSVVAADQEPVLSAAAKERVGHPVVHDGRAVERKGAVGPAATAKVVDAGGVDVARSPFGENGRQGVLAFVEGRGTGNQNVIVRFAKELISAG